MADRLNFKRGNEKARIIPIDSTRGALNSQLNRVPIASIDELLIWIKNGINTDEELAYITASYYSLPLDGRLALLASLGDITNPLLLGFLRIAALDEKVAPCLEVASVLCDIVDERASEVIRILLSHDNKAVRQAAREVLFSLRGKGLALPLDKQEPLPASTLPWWTEKCPVHKVAFWTSEGKARIGAVVARVRPDGDLAVFGFQVDATGAGITNCFYAPEFNPDRFRETFLKPENEDLLAWEGRIEDLEEIAAFGYGLSMAAGNAVPLAFYQGKFLMGPTADRFNDIDVYTCRQCKNPLDFETMDYIRGAWHVELLPEKDFLCCDCYSENSETEDWEASWESSAKAMEECLKCDHLHECNSHQDDLLGESVGDYPMELTG